MTNYEIPQSTRWQLNDQAMTSQSNWISLMGLKLFKESLDPRQLLCIRQSTLLSQLINFYLFIELF